FRYARTTNYAYRSDETAPTSRRHSARSAPPRIGSAWSSARHRRRDRRSEVRAAHDLGAGLRGIGPTVKRPATFASSVSVKLQAEAAISLLLVGLASFGLLDRPYLADRPSWRMYQIMISVRQAKTVSARMTEATASCGVPAERRLSHISTGSVWVSRSVRN